MAVRTKRTRCSNCRFHEIGLKGDHALRCKGKMGLTMRHDAIKVLVARASSKQVLRSRWSKAEVYLTKDDQEMLK